MRNIGPTNLHGTALPPKQWLYQKEDAGMENSKMYCPSQCRNSTYQCRATNYLVSWGQCRDGNGNMRNFGPTNPHGYRFYTKAMVISKGSYEYGELKICIARVGCRNSTYLCEAANYPVSMRGSIVTGIEICEIWPTNPHGTVFAPRQWLYQKEAMDMESLKVYCPSRCRNSTYQYGTAN